MFIDTHCHLCDKEFNSDFNLVLERAFENKVMKIIVPGSDLRSSEKALEAARNYDAIYAACGIHPHDSARSSNEDLRRLEKLAADKKVVAVGEIGLDFHYNFSPKDIQKKTFAEQLFIAKKIRKPVIVHSRECFLETLDILKSERSSEGVIHCFSYGREEVKLFLDLGFYIGFTGSVTFKKADQIRDAVAYVPIDRLLCETDGPYMAPVPNRGKRNEPSFIPLIAAKLAEIKRVSVENLAYAVLHNAEKLFNI